MMKSVSVLIGLIGLLFVAGIAQGQHGPAPLCLAGGGARMVRRFVAVVAGMMAVAVALAEGGAEAEELTGPFPVVESPTGDWPVGHWECWVEQDFEETKARNTGIYPRRCAPALPYSATVLELLPGGYGWILAIQTARTFVEASDKDFNPDEAFRIAGAERLYSRAGEMRWALDRPGDWKACDDPNADTCLRIQTTRNERYSVTRLSPDVIRLTDTFYGTKRLLFRTASESSRAILRFRECVIANDGRNLFDVEPCESPLPVSARVAVP